MIMKTTLLIFSIALTGLASADQLAKKEVTPGKLLVINVSAQMVNELIVPFASPSILTFLGEDTQASIQNDGKSIYVSTGNEDFVQLIVKNRDAPDPPLTFTCQPHAIGKRRSDFSARRCVDSKSGRYRRRSILIKHLPTEWQSRN